MHKNQTHHKVAEAAKEGLFLQLFGNGAIDPAIAANFFRSDSDVLGMISQTVQKAIYGSPLGKSRSESVGLTDPTEMTWPTALRPFEKLIARVPELPGSNIHGFGKVMRLQQNVERVLAVDNVPGREYQLPEN
jgi:hypothetical protein